MTKRENYLIAARGGKPEWVPCFPDDCNVFFPDFWHKEDPVTGTDFCNVKWTENEYGRMPVESWRAMDDLSQWRETIKFPDLKKLDWDGMKARHMETHDPEKVNIAMLNDCGIFLTPINMIGWVDGLSAIHEDPEELESLISALTDFFVELTGYLCSYFNPDIIFAGDDVAAGDGPLMSLKTWNALYKPYFQKINDAIHAHGALAEFHCCGNCGFFIEEFLSIGSDICQLPVPNDDLLKDKERLGSSLVLTGGWDRKGKGAMPGASEQEVRESVHVAIDTYGKDGALIFWDGGICGQSEDANNKRKWLYDEFHKYKYEVYN